MEKHTNLNKLVAFLNYDFTEGNDSWRNHSHSLFNLLFQPKFHLTSKTLRDLQREICGLLRPIIGPQPWEIKELYRNLENLISDIAVFRFVRSIEPYDDQWVRQYGSENDAAITELLKRPRSTGPLAGERLLTIGGYRWLLEKHFTRGGSPRSRCYSIIAELLENGQFSKLRACKELLCRRVFVAKRSPEKYCTECRKRDRQRSALDRAKKSKGKRKLEYQEKENQAREQEVLYQDTFNRICNFINLATRKDLTSGALARIDPVVRELGQGKPKEGWRIISTWEKKRSAGVSTKDLVESLDRREKETIDTLWR